MQRPRILVIDNYDSFVFNLARYITELGGQAEVWRNDQFSLGELETARPDGIIISPGPCTPAEAGQSNGVITHFGPRIPILGVCLGHQCIGQVYGGQVQRAEQPMHGKASRIEHNQQGVFAGLPSPLAAGRYHSLIVAADGLPDDLQITASSEDGVIMGLRHKTHPVFGVQFHPESVLTEHGHALLRNFMDLT